MKILKEIWSYRTLPAYLSFNGSSIYYLLKTAEIRCKSNKYFNSNNLHTSTTKCLKIPNDGYTLKDFITPVLAKDSYTINENIEEEIPYIDSTNIKGWNRKVYFDVYGCQMNVNDTEIVWSILQSAGFTRTNIVKNADVIFLMTCAIREKAETKVWNKLLEYKALKKSRQGKRSNPLKVGVLGCMAERLKQKLIEQEKSVDIVAGPDSYRDLPRLLSVTTNNQTAINVVLSHDETYADIVPLRLNEDLISAYVSIMRGCDNMCTYCIVPFTRGKERSRPIDSILKEIESLSSQGIKEVTLLGQNVNSYRDICKYETPETITSMSKGFKTVYKPKKGGLRFADLLDKVACVDGEMRIRFTSPHPKDFPDEVLDVIKRRHNVCCNLHLPAQSGNNDVLERMRRGYTREAYIELVKNIRKFIPDVALSSDFICGFCGETDDEFEDTIDLIKEVGYHSAFLFAYSMREKTTAFRRYKDDVPPDVKQSRLLKMFSTFRERADALNKEFIGKNQIILIEGDSKRSNKFLAGRNDANIKVIIPSIEVPKSVNSPEMSPIIPGNYILVKVVDANSQVLKGIPLHHTFLSNTSYEVF